MKYKKLVWTPFLALAFLVSFHFTAFCQGKNYESFSARVNGVTIHYLKAGTGKMPLVFLHGFGETSHMWTPMFDEFGKDFTMIAPDLRGIGESSQPATAYGKKTAAVDIHELVKVLDLRRLTFTVPVLILHGTDDRATRPAGSQKFFDTAGSTDKTLKLYEGHYHDLLNDVDKEIVMADMRNWLDERLPVETSTVSASQII